MSEYIYKATDRAGKVMEGSFDAPDEAAVVSRLRGMGCIPIRIEQAAAGAKPRSRKISINIDFKTRVVIKVQAGIRRGAAFLYAGACDFDPGGPAA